MKNLRVIPAQPARLHHQKTFTNPLLSSGADPWCIYKDGYYYYTHTTATNITLWKTKCLGELATAQKKIIFKPPVSGPCSKNLWAPEIHFLEDKWYIYFAADTGDNNDHRLWVLENESPDPMKGTWLMKGKLTTPEDKWSIDGTAFRHHQQLYFIWSGWEGDTNGQQNIYIAKMKNPWTLENKRVLLSSPELDWETIGDLHDNVNPSHVKVNEGPVVLFKEDQIFLVYSASGCWTDSYALGMLTASIDSDPMNPDSWKKNQQPVFKQSKKNKVYGPGHSSFFKSPDGTEDFIMYHANATPNAGCDDCRSTRTQKFTWNDDGTPNFGIPVKIGEAINLPSENKILIPAFA